MYSVWIGSSKVKTSKRLEVPLNGPAYVEFWSNLVVRMHLVSMFFKTLRDQYQLVLCLVSGYFNIFHHQFKHTQDPFFNCFFFFFFFLKLNFKINFHSERVSSIYFLLATCYCNLHYFLPPLCCCLPASEYEWWDFVGRVLLSHWPWPIGHKGIGGGGKRGMKFELATTTYWIVSSDTATNGRPMIVVATRSNADPSIHLYSLNTQSKQFNLISPFFANWVEIRQKGKHWS